MRLYDSVHQSKFLRGDADSLLKLGRALLKRGDIADAKIAAEAANDVLDCLLEIQKENPK